MGKISTHDLTRRSTFKFGYNSSDALFQLTTSQGGRPLDGVGCTLNDYISTHDLTRRSTVLADVGKRVSDISTHDLTRRSTQKAYVNTGGLNISTHDLTRRSTV